MNFPIRNLNFPIRNLGRSDSKQVLLVEHAVQYLIQALRFRNSGFEFRNFLLSSISIGSLCMVLYCLHIGRAEVDKSCRREIDRKEEDEENRGCSGDI